MAITTDGENRLTPKQAAKEVIKEALWNAEMLCDTSAGESIEGHATDREIELVSAQIEKLFSRINKILD